MNEWLQTLIRSLSLFIIVLVLIRLMGKRSISRMNPFNFVSNVVIAIIAALISTNVIENIAFGLTALGVWALLPIVIDYLSLKSKWIHDWVNGKETILIKHGKVMEENLMQARLTGQELLRELRAKNAFSFADVEFALMETNGDISVLVKADKKPVTAHDLGKKVAPQTEPQTVILDGNVLNESLAALGQNRQWLNLQLENMGVSLDNVFIGQVDSSGDLFVDLFDDAVQVPQSQVKEMLYANMEKCQADLSTYALETQNEEARQMYGENAQKLKEVLEKLEPYLLR